jgi:preprotein translocase subunit SecY
MRVPKLLKRVAMALGGLALFEAGVRLVLPGLIGPALGQYLRNGGGSLLLTLYDKLGGGGLSRGGVLALGILPYISATIMMRLARVISPPVDGLSASAEGRIRLRRWTRGLTVGLALIQSYGFARFVQGIPGAVMHPGFGFIAQAMAVLTAGSVVAMVVTEQLSAPADDDDITPLTPPASNPLLAPGEVVPTGNPVRADADLKVR